MIEDLPTKVLHLARADNGASVAHVSSTRNEKDAGAEVSVSDAASNGKAQIVDSVIIDAIEVDGAREVGVDASVTASNGAVSATIDQSKVLSRSECVNQVFTNGVNISADGVWGRGVVGITHRGVIGSGRRHQRRLTSRPAGMSLARLAVGGARLV